MADNTAITAKRFDKLTVTELYEILKFRSSVFVVEQNCAYQDIDDRDADAYHVFMKNGNEITAYLRVMDRGVMFDDVSIGRVAVKERRKGYATKLLKAGLRIAKDKFQAECVVLEAQTYAAKLYENLGFICVSEEFLEDGIPHVKMCLKF